MQIFVIFYINQANQANQPGKTVLLLLPVTKNIRRKEDEEAKNLGYSAVDLHDFDDSSYDGSGRHRTDRSEYSDQLQ